MFVINTQTLLFNLLFILLVSKKCNSFSVPTKSYNKKINKIGELGVTEPFFNEQKNDAIIFFTGGSSNIPQEIYSSFLNSVAGNNISAYTFNNNIENIDYLSKVINKRHNNIGFVGHSSGCMKALEKSNNFSKLKSIILFDPVDDRIIKNARTNLFETITGRNKEKLIDICCPENFIVVKSENSYKWNFNPFRTPFIPFFGLNTKNINFEKIENEYIENIHDDDFDFDFDSTDEFIDWDNDKKFDDRILKTTIKKKCYTKLSISLPKYGHCDIIDDRWSNIMHNSVAMGITPRNERILQNYRDGCAFIVSSCFQENVNPKNIRKELMNTYKIKNNINKL